MRWAMGIVILVGCGTASAPHVEDTAPIRYTTAGGPLDIPPLPVVAHNPQRQSAIELGRMLFYDTRLSASGTLSCASCHAQALGFADGVALSDRGASNKTLGRHAPTLINLAWATNGVFWDGGAKNLESQVLAPIVSPDEMGSNLGQVLHALQSDIDYVRAFDDAFGDDLIEQGDLAKALAQFIRALVSTGSRYDRYVRGEADGYLTEREFLGREVFDRACRGCHASDLFTDQAFHNNGLDSVFSDEHEGIHLGRARISGDGADRGKFKTPTLRNIAVSAPYMHDGRLASLPEVIEHYRSGVRDSETLDPRLRNIDGSVGLVLSDDEAGALLAFLETLTDEDFLSSASFAPRPTR